jgi:predicted MFS family arabinose efflux permease
VVKVNAGGDLDGDDCRDHEVDHEAERRPPLRVGHELSAVLPEVLQAMTGEADDKAIIGWTLSAFAFAGCLGSILGGFLAPRLGPILTIVGAFLLTLCPILAVIASEPGTALYFAAIALAGILIFVPVPALIIIAQEFVPGAPATASGMVLGLGSALAGIGYVVLGRVQEAVGLTSGILIGFSMVVPAALIALVVLLRARGETRCRRISLELGPAPPSTRHHPPRSVA